MSVLSEKKQELKNKIKILFALGFVQIWFWPVWFEYAVHSAPTAVSSFLTMCAAVIYNVIVLVDTYQQMSDLGD